MITELTTPFVESKNEFITWLLTVDYPSYESLLCKALELIDKEPDPQRIHRIDDGDYQGTLVFVIGAKGYQPHQYWTTTVYYGSCSGCDTLEDAWGYGNNRDMEALYTIALHLMQGMRELDD